MLQKLALWFICFGLSFFVASFGLAEQGEAFMYINLGACGLLIVGMAIIFMIFGTGVLDRLGISLMFAVPLAIYVAGMLFATWGATKLFDIDFYVAFQIMTFGQCLSSFSVSFEYK